MTEITPLCVGCHLPPEEITSCVMFAEDQEETPSEYVRKYEGTYNRHNGHFLCDGCYIDAGMPVAPGGWIAP